MRAMAGFSLSISRGQEQGETDTLFLYGSGGAGVEITTRGFELWQPAPPSQDQEIQLSLPQHELGGSVRRGASGAGGGGFSCQDCGNQAKKDCVHMRCRTCCKSRGLHCPTHVKSTWIPVAKRRERQQQRTAGNTAAAMSSQRERDPGADQGGKHGGGGQLSRRQKEVADLTTGASGATRGSYPAEVSTHAAFRCVRVSAADEAEDECAYQTAVSIGGHVFKGILYDHGPEAETATLTPGAGPSCFHRHLTGSSSPPPADIMAAAAAAAAAASAAGAEPSATAPAAVAFLDAYPASLNAFMAGTQFFPHHSRP